MRLVSLYKPINRLVLYGCDAGSIVASACVHLQCLSHLSFAGPAQAPVTPPPKHLVRVTVKRREIETSSTGF